MNVKKVITRAFSTLLVMLMLIGMLPVSALAVEADATLTASLAETKSYVDGITINNTSNDPYTVVSKYGTHFTWDNEKRESGKSYLYDWSYYNGVVFEGIEYLYEVTGEEVYKDYFVEYMSTLIASDGTWAKCANNSSKECAGYNSTHGADCYKTASLLLDAYEITGDDRYLKIAAVLYADLDSAANSYLLSNAGNNYRHTWASDSSPDLWLDGLYMILPFRAEYAKYIGDKEELDLIVNRLQWVSDNMYNESKRLFYHAADSATSNSGTYWLRSIGWYAAAIVDVMDSMDGENLEKMKAQLIKLVDGMIACQNPSNGMWLNNMDASQSSSNPYETSGTALVCYAIMKAVNNGWLDESYADNAILAFNGICSEKLNGSNLTDICFKGAPGSSNSTFYDNEGKGVGPFIMFYAEVAEYVNKTTVTYIDENITITATASDVTAISAANAVNDSTAAKIESVIDTEGTYVAYDVALTGNESGADVTYTMTVANDISADDLVLYHVASNGTLTEIGYTFTPASGAESAYITFGTKLSGTFAYGTKAAAEDDSENVTGAVSGTGKLVGGTVYTLAKNGVTAGKKYLIVNTGSDGDGFALRNNGGSVASFDVDISDEKITVADDSDIAWTFNSNSSGTISNDGKFVYPGNNSLSLSDSGTNLTISNQNDGKYAISLKSGYWTYYIRYNNGWTASYSWNGTYSVYLYEYTSTSSGEDVTFEVTPGSATIKPDGTTVLTGKVTVGGKTVDLSKCTVAWTSSNTAAATVSGGTVTGAADGKTNITATLSAVDGTALEKNIELIIPVTVQSRIINEDSLVLSGSPVNVVCGKAPDFSGVTLVGNYADGDKEEVTVYSSDLTFSEIDTSMPGTQYVTVTYGGKTFTLIVNCANDYSDFDDATEYPAYPEDGAVRIDKTATERDFEDTGIVEVELDVAGISVKGGVDVVLIVDVSNSMAWSLENSGDSTESNRLPSEGQTTKLDDAMASAMNFANILLGDNTGEKTDNTLSFITFAGYDSTFGQDSKDDACVDSLMQVFMGVTDPTLANNAFENTKFTSTTTTYTLQIAGTDGNTIVSGNNRGDTNYDYAFWQGVQTVNAIKAANEQNGQENRDIIVVFMTDGAPSHYNGVNKNGNSGRDDRLPDNTSTSYKTGSKYVQDDWFAHFSGNSNTYGKTLYDAVNGNFHAIGFDLEHGGLGDWQWSESQLAGALKQVAYQDEEKEVDVFATADAAELNEFYKNLAIDIKFAGTAAQVTDILGSKFTLQMSETAGTEGVGRVVDLSEYEIEPTITVKAYDLHPKGTHDDDGNDITGTRTGGVTDIEVITFSEDGTKAYSNVIGAGKNIMSTANGVTTIAGKYFTYTKTADGSENINWYIGNITDKELAFTFYAYLKGALEGEAPKTTYATNESAVLEYVDIGNKYATQTFPVPIVAWGGASTAYEFYLVNGDGDPCDRKGNIIPFANRIIITGPYYDELYLNQDDEYVSEMIAAEYVLPAGYTLYDSTAQYEVMTASGKHEGSLTISEPAVGKKQTTILVSATTPSYIQSRVAFGVNYNDIPGEAQFELVPDSVVIDYGKSIVIDPAENNDIDEKAEGYSVEFIGFSKYYEGIDLKQQYTNTTARSPFPATYGTFTVTEDKKVQYTPTAFVNGVDSIICVFKFSKGADIYYMADVLHIIPASFVYYETDFAGGVFSYSGGTCVDNDESSVGWRAAARTDSTYGAETNKNPDGPQDYKVIGTDLYGYDSSYANDAVMSNGSSEFARGNLFYDEETGTAEITTYASFGFKGTGFDIISRTGTAQGLIKVVVTDSNGNVDKTVSVLNKSESSLTLYQVPVVSVNGLTYDTYKVEIYVDGAYENTTNIPALDVLNRGNEFFFDAVRIYDPVDVSGVTATGTNMVFDAYVADGEAFNELFEVRSLLLASNTFDVTDEADGVIFVDRDQSSVGISDYSTIGPNNEVYLIGDQTIGFKIKIDPENPPVSVDLGAKSADGREVTLYTEVWIGDEVITSFGDEGIDIAAATAQYYDLMAGNTDFADESEITVVVENYGEGVLSITDIKVGFGAKAGTVNVYSDPGVLYRMLNRPTAEPDYTSYDVISAEFTTETVVRKKTATLIIETAEAVETITVTNAGGREEKIQVESVETADGVKTWTVTFKITATGYKTFTVTGCGADGTTGATATASITVTR